VAARVAAMLAAQPEAAEAAGLRPVWLTLQALSAQDAAPVESADTLHNSSAAAPAYAMAAAMCSGSLPCDSMHSAGRSIEAGGCMLPGGIPNGSSAAHWRPEAAAGTRSRSTGSSCAASREHCSGGGSESSESGESKHVNTPGAVLLRSIPRIGSSGSDGSLWGDSSADDR
jgi:hypothetical protein